MGVELHAVAMHAVAHIPGEAEEPQAHPRRASASMRELEQRVGTSLGLLSAVAQVFAGLHMDAPPEPAEPEEPALPPVPAAAPEAPEEPAVPDIPAMAPALPAVPACPPVAPAEPLMPLEPEEPPEWMEPAAPPTPLEPAEPPAEAMTGVLLLPPQAASAAPVSPMMLNRVTQALFFIARSP